MTHPDTLSAEAFKALGDPVRWTIVRHMATVGEVRSSTLEELLPLARPAISYHTRILAQAGLLSVRKQGRNYFYALRRELVRQLIEQVRELAPEGGREDTLRPATDDGGTGLITW